MILTRSGYSIIVSSILAIALKDGLDFARLYFALVFVATSKEFLILEASDSFAPFTIVNLRLEISISPLVNIFFCNTNQALFSVIPSLRRSTEGATHHTRVGTACVI